MNKDVFEGKWKQRRGQVRERWGTRRVTDDDLDRVARKYDKLIGVLQEKHGYTRERAEKELNWRMAKHVAHQKKSRVPTAVMRRAEGQAGALAGAEIGTKHG